MLKMKKMLAVLTAVLLAVACVATFASCTSSSDKDQETGTTAGTEGGTTAETVPAEKKVLKMATNAYFKPYEYYEGDKIIGIDAEIAAAIAEKMGMKLEIVDMKFDSILTAVNTGSVDFGMAGMTVNEKRQKEVDFTISYANGVQAIIVKQDSAIKTADDLSAEGATYKVGVQLGTTGDQYSTDDFGKDRVIAYSSANEAVLALGKGDVDCVIIDNEPAKSLVNANKGLKILETSYTNEDYAICVSKKNPELLKKLNQAIMELTEEGKIDEIIGKYIH